MQEVVRVIVVPYLVSPAEHRVVYDVPWRLGLTVGEAIVKAKDHLDYLGITELSISCNGYESTPLQELAPDDIIVVSAYQGAPAIASLLVAYAGVSATVAAVVANVVVLAITIGAGLLINSIMAPSEPAQQRGEKSTYGWGGMQNSTQPGVPVPVTYGTNWSAPPIVGSYRKVDNDYNMWQYFLLLVGGGKTNLMLTVDDVRIGDEPLTTYIDYVFRRTNGKNNVDHVTKSALKLFEKVTHDYPYDRRIKYDARSSTQGLLLLNYNTPIWEQVTEYSLDTFIFPTTLGSYCYKCTVPGTSGGLEPSPWGTVLGGTTADGGVVWTCHSLDDLEVINTSNRATPNWTKNGNVVIKTDTPKWGNGYINFPADGDYIETDDYETLLMSRPVQVEFWFRMPDLNDRIFFFTGNDTTYPGDLVFAGTTFGFIGGMFRLQSSKVTLTPADVELGADPLLMEWGSLGDMLIDVTPTLNEWRYVRILSNMTTKWIVDGEYYLTRGKVTVQIQNDDGGLDSFDDSDFVMATDDREIPETVTPYADLTDKLRFVQYIGYGRYIDDTTNLPVELYGNCDIDCFRTTRGEAYAASDDTLPTAEIVEDATAEFVDDFLIQTRNKCDSVSIILEFRQGLGYVTDTGGVSLKSVSFAFWYRSRGATSWTESTVVCTARRVTSTPRFQFTIDLPTRGLYDILLYRISQDHEDRMTTKDLSWLVSFQEIINLQQLYPGLQMLVIGVKASDKASGQLGVISVNNHRTIIEVPDWVGDGTRFVDPSIPANQMYDACTNQLYGIRQSPSMLKRSAFTEWFNWTEELVDGVKRATCNITYDEQGNFADDFLRHIEQAGRVRMLREGGLWKPVVDKPRTPQYVFSAGNILPASKGSKESSCQWSGYDDTEKVDAVTVTWYDESKYGVRRTTSPAKASWFETLTRQPKIQDVEIRGCNNKDEALRHARYRINKNEYIEMQGSHKAGMQCAGIEFGEVFTLIPSSYRSVWGGNLRCDHSGESTIHLNGRVNLSGELSGEVRLFAVGPAGEYYNYPISGPWDIDTSNLTIVGGHVGNRGDAIGIGCPTTDKLSQQVLKVRHDFSARETYFDWCTYSDNVFYHSRWGSGEIPI